MKKQEQKQKQTFDWSRKDPSTQVVYNYPDSMEIYPKTQIAKTFANDGYLKVMFPTDSKQWSRPHLTIRDTSYHLSALTVLAKPHPELVLEHTPMTNGTPIFVRIPLTTQNTLFYPHEETCLDRLIQLSVVDSADGIPCDLNRLLYKGSLAALYKGSALLYWKTPISIQTDLSTIKNAISPWTDMELPLYHPDYRIVLVRPDTKSMEGFPFTEVAEGFQEGFDEEEYDCKIVDESEDQVNLMQIPYLSDSLTNIASKNMMQSVLYLFYMGIIIVLGIYVFPGVYLKMLTIATDGEVLPGTDAVNAKMMQPKNKALQCFIWIVGIFTFITTLMFLTDGVIRGDSAETAFGLIVSFLVILILTFITIYNTLFIYTKGEYKFSVFLGNLVAFTFQPFLGKNIDGKIERGDNYEALWYSLWFVVSTIIIFVVSVVAFPKEAKTFSPAFYVGCIFLALTVTILTHYSIGYKIYNDTSVAPTTST